jgi:uncharacterized protein
MDRDKRIAAWIWAALGFATTASLTWSSPAVVQAIATTDSVFWGLLIAQLASVLMLATDEHSLPSSMRRALLFLYASLTGVILAVALQALTAKSMVAMFLMTVGVFVGLARYCAGLRRRLAAFGHLMFIGLLGLALASAVVLLWPGNIFN